MKVLKNVLKAVGHLVWDFIKFSAFMIGCCLGLLVACALLGGVICWLFSFIPEGVLEALYGAMPYVVFGLLGGCIIIAIGWMIKDEYDRIVDADERKAKMVSVDLDFGGEEDDE